MQFVMARMALVAVLLTVAGGSALAATPVDFTTTLVDLDGKSIPIGEIAKGEVLTLAIVAETALLRLEMATELPTPAEHLSARRMLQLQLLTQRHAPAPDQTWGEDMAKVLAAPHDAAQARRVQNVLKALFKR